MVQNENSNVSLWRACKVLHIGAQALGTNGLLRRAFFPSHTVTGHSTIFRYRPTGGRDL